MITSLLMRFHGGFRQNEGGKELVSKTLSVGGLVLWVA